MCKIVIGHSLKTVWKEEVKVVVWPNISRQSAVVFFKKISLIPLDCSILTDAACRGRNLCGKTSHDYKVAFKMRHDGKVTVHSTVVDKRWLCSASWLCENIGTNVRTHTHRLSLYAGNNHHVVLSKCILASSISHLTFLSRRVWLLKTPKSMRPSKITKSPLPNGQRLSG